MVIPKSFNIFGQTIRVKWRKTLLKKEKAWGLWDANSNTIFLQVPGKGIELSKEQLEQTFMHEVLHACLDILNYEQLSENENFIDRLSNALHQVIVTSLIPKPNDIG